MWLVNIKLQIHKTLKLLGKQDIQQDTQPCVYCLLQESRCNPTIPNGKNNRTFFMHTLWKVKRNNGETFSVVVLGFLDRLLEKIGNKIRDNLICWTEFISTAENNCSPTVVSSTLLHLVVQVTSESSCKAHPGHPWNRSKTGHTHRTQRTHHQGVSLDELTTRCYMFRPTEFFCSYKNQANDRATTHTQLQE